MMRFEEFCGTPYEIGAQKGERCREPVAAWVASMHEWWRRDWGATDEVLSETCRRLRANAEVNYPELLQEMDGIADGAGLSRQEVLLHNHYGYLWGTLGAQPASDSCTSVGYAQTPQGPILGQNLDIGGGEYYFCELSRPTTGYATLTDGWYGMCFGDCGVNEHGLAVGTSALGFRPYLNDWATGYHNHFVTRLVLRNCRNVAEATAYLEHAAPMIPLTSGKTYLLLDESGDMAVVEKSQDIAPVRREHVGCMATSNFVLHPEALGYIANDTAAVGEMLLNSYNRQARIMRLFEEAGRKGSLELMMHTLRWHEMPGAVCRHEGSDPSGYSRISAIALPRERALYISDGPPCMNEYSLHAL